jgi:hypothetical protein
MNLIHWLEIGYLQKKRSFISQNMGRADREWVVAGNTRVAG